MSSYTSPSSPVTRAKLMTRINQRGNTSGYLEQTQELPQLVDTSLAKLHNLLAGELYEDFFQRKFVISLMENQQYYALPPDFMKLRALFYLDPSPGQDPLQGNRWLMARRDASEQTGLALNTTYPNQVWAYSMEDQSLCIYPQPVGPGPFNQLLLFYIPTYRPPANDNTPIEFAIAFGWDEWVVNDVVVAARLKAMMPVEEIMRERDSYMQNLRIQAKNRNALQPPKVRNTGWRYGNAGYPWGSFAFNK